MNQDRSIRINELADLLWDDASEAWYPEASWAGILAPHCKDDPSLSANVCRFVRASTNEDLDVKDQLNVLPFEATEVSVPDQIGEYKVLSVLGAGGMGVVYAAEFKGPGMEPRPRAIKVAKDSPHADAVMRRLRAEINLLSRLHHPNIVQIHDAGTTEKGTPYLVMELVEGGLKLDEYCATHAVPLVERVALFQRVCSAIEYLHGENIVHRDLTTGNILVTKTGETKILDLGLSVFLKPVENAPSYANSDQTPRRLGTPGYMSPEQARGEQGRTSDDVWALGAILELLISSAPTDSPGSTRLRNALLNVIASCHQPELPKRIESVAMLTRIVGNAVADANAHLVTRILKLSASRRGRVIAALGILAAVSAGGWWYENFRRNNEARARESATRFRAYELHEKVVARAIDGFKAFYEPMFTPLTKRTGPLEVQVEYVSQLALAGDATAKGLFGFAILMCRASTLEVQRHRKTMPREERQQTSSYVLKRFFKVERSKQDEALAIQDQIDIEERAFEAVLNICSESNVRQGITWLEEVASNGQAAAAAFLAQAFYEGVGGLPNNPSRALDWAKKAIEGDHPQGYRVLSELYRKGEAVPLSMELSIENTHKAARYGDILSQYRMAVAFQF